MSEPAGPKGGDDRLLGSLAVREGYISAQQVEECVGLQKQAAPPRKLGEILIEKGYLTPTRLASILDIQSRQVKMVAADPARGGLLGQIALDLGFVNADQVNQALEEQTLLSRSGSPAMLGQILLRKGWLQTGQFLEILKIQRATIIRCPGCDTVYRFEETDRGAKFACRRCGTVVLIPVADAAPAPSIAQQAGAAKRPGETGAQFGRYAVLEELGRGGMGIVYKALHRDLNMVFALKILRETEVASAEVLDRFRREAQAEARLRHPNIVTIHDAGQEAGVHYIAMDYIEGDPLTAHLIRGFKVRDMISRLEKVVRAVQHAHEQGIIHRDLKPANIMIDLRGDPHIMDFGLAKFVDDHKRAMLTRSGSFLGTPYYMAPEQIRGETRLVGPRSDIYSLGIILYEILCGRTPHVAQNSVEIFHKILNEEPPPPRIFNARVHPDLQTICMKAIEKDPGLRYASAGEFADDLRRYLDGEPIMARVRPWPSRLLRRIRKNKSAALAALSLLLVAFSGGFLFFLLSRDARAVERLRSEAQRHFDLREYDQALLAAEGARRLRPNDKSLAEFVDWTRTRKAAQSREFQEAIETDQRRRDAEPKIRSARAMLEMLPREAAREGYGAADVARRCATIEGLLDEAIKFAPGHEEALFLRGRSKAFRGAPGPALEDLSASLARAPDHLDALYDRARVRLGRITVLELTEARPPGIPVSSILVEDRRRALADFKAVLQRVPRDPVRLEFCRAAVSYLDGQAAEAGRILAPYVDQFPGDPEARRLRAVARFMQGDLPGAEADLGRAIGYAPADPGLLLWRAWVLHGKGEAKQADADLEAARAMSPSSAAPPCVAGRILLDRGRFADAAARYAAAAEFEDAWSSALVGAGLAKVKEGDLEGSLAPLKKAVAADPGDAWPHLLRAEALAGLDRTAEGLDHAESAVQLAPETAAAYEWRGRILRKMGKPDAALRDFEKASALDPAAAERLDPEVRAVRARLENP